MCIRDSVEIIVDLDAHLHALADGVDLGKHAHAVRCDDILAHLGQLLERLGIVVLLVFEAAHEPSAEAGDLRGIEGKVLLLGHLDGHGLEIAQEGAAADGPTAGAEAAEHLRLVAHADLTKLYAHLEHLSLIHI